MDESYFTNIYNLLNLNLQIDSVARYFDVPAVEPQPQEEQGQQETVEPATVVASERPQGTRMRTASAPMATSPVIRSGGGGGSGY